MYNYENGKKNIREILGATVDINEKDVIPENDKFTFGNAYYGWVSAIFVDIRNSTELFVNGNKVKVSKIIRAFTSEIIDILRENNNLREIGIRGDCVYAIYATPGKTDVYDIADLTFWVNTYVKMLNEELLIQGWKPIRVGIGMATDQELVVKAGRPYSNVNSHVWIGKAVTFASKLSGIANKDDNSSILFSNIAYVNFIGRLCTEDHNAKKWFTERFSLDVGRYYMANIVKTQFNDWIARTYNTKK